MIHLHPRVIAEFDQYRLIAVERTQAVAHAHKSWWHFSGQRDVYAIVVSSTAQSYALDCLGQPINLASLLDEVTDLKGLM